MKYDLNVEIKTLDGGTVKADDGGVLTVKDAVLRALLSPIPGEDSEQPKKKFERWLLAKRVYAAESEVELTAEEVSEIKDRVAKIWAASVLGPVFELLEGSAR